jgi:hypothetical protein
MLVTSDNLMNWDVVVWGGGTGGVAAAVQAARAGASTLLLTPAGWLGGMLSAAGVSAPDGSELSCWQTGFWGALLRDLERSVADGLDHNWVSCFGFRPSQAEAILQRWVAEETRLSWWSDVELLDVQHEVDRIVSLTVERRDDAIRLAPTVVIDGSDLGDLMAAAEAPFRFGWEADTLWSEPSAPSSERLDQEPFFQQQPIQSPTWVVMGQLREGAGPDLPVVSPEPPFQDCFESCGLRRTLTYGRLPGGLVMLNWPLNGNDWHQGLDRCISNDRRERQDLAEAMQAHSLRFLHTLRTSSDGWLQAGRAFPGQDPCLALMPYWREGRRLVGCDVVTENDLLPIGPDQSHGPLPMDDSGHCTSIAVGNYANDHHYPGDDWPLAPKSIPWGGRWTGTPFCIPYGALFGSSVSNLLMADKAISVSHMANGATRLQPLIINIGQAAGMAAALSLKHQCLPSELPVQELQTALLNDPIAPAAVMPIWTIPFWHDSWRSAQHEALQDPSILQNASAQTVPASSAAPVEQSAIQLEGAFLANSESDWQLQTSQGPQSLMTLEPGVRNLLSQCKNGTRISLVAVENRWGPWLRVLRAEII